MSRVATAVAGITLLGAAVLGCAGHSKVADAGASDPDRARADALLVESSVLPARPEVVSLAEAIEARAQREGAGARAVSLHAVAARLTERVWRVEHRSQDAKEAQDLYRAAASDLALPGACDAAMRSAFLAGEIARDASATYSELYRVSRRGATGADAGASANPCAGRADDALAGLSPFRPPPSVLAAIDEGLAGEGALSAAIDAGARVAVAPRITKIEQWGGDDAARVVVTLERAARYRVGDEPGAGGKGARTYVEIDGAQLGSVSRETPMAGLATRVFAEPISTGSRVALDLSGPAYRKVFHLVEPYRIVIDIAKSPPGLAPKSRTVSRVVLDPGHGGNDPGATGPSGLKEKDVTLAIAHKVAPVLARQGLAVTLTRDDDRFVTLEERTARANGFGADLFVSIHCNASENHGRRGVETYVLDTTTSDIAARVAARENATSQAANAELGTILANMRLADQASRSTRLAELLQRAALASMGGQYKDVVDGGVHTAGFYVLVGARMPGVLFETSYISNPAEETRLASEDYQNRLADAVVNAVKAYREGR